MAKQKFYVVLADNTPIAVLFSLSDAKDFVIKDCNQGWKVDYTYHPTDAYGIEQAWKYTDEITNYRIICVENETMMDALWENNDVVPQVVCSHFSCSS